MNFLHAALDKFDFGPSFKQWVTTLYNGANSRIINNGHLSDKIHLERGIRQGCPLSALLFILSVEILACAIRQDNILAGINIKGNKGTREVRICQLADDTTLFVKDRKSVERALEIVQCFGNKSGLELNKGKTEGLWLGTAKYKDAQNIGDIKWPAEPIKALGIYFGHDKNKVEQLNWEPKINKLRDVLRLWQQRGLTMLGRVLITKTLGLSNCFITHRW